MPARAVLSHIALGLLDQRLLPQCVRELLPRRADHVIAEIDLRKSATGHSISHGFIQRKSKRQATKISEGRAGKRTRTQQPKTIPQSECAGCSPVRRRWTAWSAPRPQSAGTSARLASASRPPCHPAAIVPRRGVTPTWTPAGTCSRKSRIQKPEQ